MDVPAGEGLTNQEVPLRNAMNEVLRDGYTGDCEFVVGRWNRILEKAGRSERMYLPHRRFNREIGIYATGHYDTDGNPITDADWETRRQEWLPSDADMAFVKSLMKPCLGHGQIASWIAPPKKGINGNAFEWDYIRFDGTSAGVALGATPSLTGD